MKSESVRVLDVKVVAADAPLDEAVVTLCCAQIGERPPARSGAREDHGAPGPGQAPELRSPGS